jgi:hypothetical protein
LEKDALLPEIPKLVQEIFREFAFEKGCQKEVEQIEVKDGSDASNERRGGAILTFFEFGDIGARHAELESQVGLSHLSHLARVLNDYVERFAIHNSPLQPIASILTNHSVESILFQPTIQFDSTFHDAEL